MPKSVFSRNSVAKCYTLEVEQSKVQLTYTKMANRFLALTVSHIVRFILQVQKAVFQFQGRLCLLCRLFCSVQDLRTCLIYLRQQRCDFSRYLSLCLLAKLLKNAYMDLDDILRVDRMSGRGRTDQLLSPIRIIVRMPEPDCFLQYRMHCNARNFITSGKSHVQLFGMVIRRPSQQRRVVLRHRNSKHRCRR